MAMAATLREFLDEQGMEYEVIAHPYTTGGLQTAESAHIPGDQLAKSVLLEDENGYLIAVLPATHRIELNTLREQLNRDLELATEDEICNLFDDCETGAMPPIGEPYGIDVVYDNSLTENQDVFFEAGDHTGLVHVSSWDFQELMPSAEHGDFSRHI